jgi:hypothetical protein
VHGVFARVVGRDPRWLVGAVSGRLRGRAADNRGVCSRAGRVLCIGLAALQSVWRHAPAWRAMLTMMCIYFSRLTAARRHFCYST